MKISRFRIFSLLVLPALLITTALAKSPTIKERTAQIVTVENKRYAAMVKADIKALSPLLSEDLTYTRSTGVVQNKAGFLDEVKSGKMRYQKIESNNPTIRFYDDTAVLTGEAYFELVRYGKEEAVLAVFTSVYVLKGKARDRHWQLVAWQSNLTPTKKHIDADDTSEKTTTN